MTAERSHGRCLRGGLCVLPRGSHDWIVVGILMLTAVLSSYADLQDDCATLRLLYNTTDGPHWKNQSGWSIPTSTNCCEWYGVVCRPVGVNVTRVVELHLDNMNMAGPIPSFLGNLSAMENMTLSQNLLNETLPPDWSLLTNLTFLDLSSNRWNSSLPAQWASMTALRQLNLSINHIVGSASPSWMSALAALEVLGLSNCSIDVNVNDTSWDSLPQLRVLDVSSNPGIRGPLPSDWYERFQVLEQLDVSNCVSIGGSLPDQWSAWDQLAVLALSNCSLSSTLPPSWSEMTSLEELHLAHNSLSGSLPTEWNRFPQLRVVHLEFNDLHGSLPASWQNLTLQQLYLGANKFFGQLPTAWANWNATLEELQLSSNAMGSPTLPSEWAAWTKLKYFSCVDLELVGTLPEEYAEWSSIETILLYGNRLSGSLPSSWGRMQRLRALYLYGNKFNSSLPGAWGKMSSLTEMYMYDNEFTGELPSDWGNLTSLEALNISRIPFLQSSLPSSWAGMGGLRELYVYSCPGINSDLPPAWSSMKSIRMLYLQDNSISGQLPSSWNALNPFPKLILSNNNITGSLPPEWGNLTNVCTVDLNNNFISGDLPDSWANWTGGQCNRGLNVANNMLNGSLPSAWSKLAETFFEKDSSFYVSNNPMNGTLPAEWGDWMTKLWYMGFSNIGLTGTIPATWGMSNSRHLHTLDFSNNNLVGGLPLSWSSTKNPAPQLQVVLLSNNRLNGTLAVCAGNGLVVLQADGNEFTDVDPCVQNTSVAALNLERNPIRSVDFRSFGTTKFPAILDLHNTSLELHVEDILPQSGSPHLVVPIVNVAMNPGVTGNVQDLFSKLNTLSPTAYVDLNISSTSVGGSFDDIDPNYWAEDGYSTFPMLNLRVFDMSYLPSISGQLPHRWFDFASQLGKQLTLHVAGTNNIRCGPDCNVTFVRNIRVSYEQGTYTCDQLKWPNGVEVVGLNASYFHYETCRCSRGYEGLPPHCTTKQEEYIGLVAAFAALLGCILLFVGIKQGRAFRIRWDERKLRVRNNKLMEEERGRRTSVRTNEQSSESSVEVDVPPDPVPLNQERSPLLPAQEEESSLWLLDMSEVQLYNGESGQPVLDTDGALASVQMGYWRNRFVAVKKFKGKWEDMTDRDRHEFLREVDTHISARNAYIANIYGYTQHPSVCVIMEWMRYGSLNDVLHNCPALLPDRLKAVLQIASGMLHLHNHNIVHGNLNSLSVCVDRCKTCRLTDFGEARDTRCDDGHLPSEMYLWKSPEMFREGPQRLSRDALKKCDVYAFGIVLWELLSEARPFDLDTHGSRRPAVDNRSLSDRVLGGERPSPARIKVDVPYRHELVQLMRECWDGEPKNRPDFKTIVDQLNSMGRRDTTSTTNASIPPSTNDMRSNEASRNYGTTS